MFVTNSDICHRVYYYYFIIVFTQNLYFINIFCLFLAYNFILSRKNGDNVR